jgi:hypothetical protein
VIVWLVDTSILRELLNVPGKASKNEEVKNELAKRAKAGDRFVITITAIIETGNHICNSKQGDRRGAAERFHAMLTAVRNGILPFRLNEVDWNAHFLDCLLAGDSTEEQLVDLVGNGRFGTGDISILVERDLLRSRSNLDNVRIWTLEAELVAYS